MVDPGHISLFEAKPFFFRMKMETTRALTSIAQVTTESHLEIEKINKENPKPIIGFVYEHFIRFQNICFGAHCLRNLNEICSSPLHSTINIDSESWCDNTRTGKLNADKANLILGGCCALCVDAFAFENSTLDQFFRTATCFFSILNCERHTVLFVFL